MTRTSQFECSMIHETLDRQTINFYNELFNEAISHPFGRYLLTNESMICLIADKVNICSLLIVMV